MYMQSFSWNENHKCSVFRPGVKLKFNIEMFLRVIYNDKSHDL
jgi:hypothetical protein